MRAFWFVLLVCPTLLVAQSSSAEPSPICFRGRPLPRCAHVLIYEVGFHRLLVGSEGSQSLALPGQPGPTVPYEALHSHLSFTLGLLKNLDSLHAVGGALEIGGGTDTWRIITKARYRRWLMDRNSIDASLGIGSIRVLEPQPAVGGSVLMNRDRPGITADVAFRARDIGIGSLRADFVPPFSGRSVGAAYAGLSVGSYTAIGATVVLAAITALFIYALSGVDY